MHVIDDDLDLRERLALARAEQAEALRHAHQLRAFGSVSEFREAMRLVDAHHSTVTQLQRQLDAHKPADAAWALSMRRLYPH